MAVRRFFPEGGNVDILLILFRLLTVQRKWNFTKRFTLSFLHHKEMPYVTATVTKLCFVGSNAPFSFMLLFTQ